MFCHNGAHCRAGSLPGRILCCALDLKRPSPIGAPGTCTADASATPKEAGTRLCNARLSITASPVHHAPRVGTAGRAHLVVGRVVGALEVVQHALGLGQHEVALLPLPGLRQALPPAVLADPLLQVPRQQVACAPALGGFESQGNTSQPYRTYTNNVPNQVAQNAHHKAFELCCCRCTHQRCRALAL